MSNRVIGRLKSGAAKPKSRPLLEISMVVCEVRCAGTEDRVRHRRVVWEHAARAVTSHPVEIAPS
jgi:hypothetical protein